MKTYGAGSSRTRQVLGHRPEAFPAIDQKGKRAAACFPASTGPSSSRAKLRPPYLKCQLPAQPSRQETSGSTGQPISPRIQELMGPLEHMWGAWDHSLPKALTYITTTELSKVFEIKIFLILKQVPTDSHSVLHQAGLRVEAVSFNFIGIQDKTRKHPKPQKTEDKTTPPPPPWP